MRTLLARLRDVLGRNDLSVPIVVCAYLIGFQAPILSIMMHWSDLHGSYVAGWPVFIATVVLFFRSYRQSRPKTNLSPFWLILLAALSLLSCVALLTHTQVVLYILLIPMLYSALACFLGWAQLRPFVMPLAVLGTVIPFWDYLGWPLQRVTNAVVKALCQLHGLDIQIQGWLIHLKGAGTFNMANGTAGLRYLIPVLALSLILGSFRFRRWQARLALFLGALFLAAVMNWVRVYLSVLGLSRSGVDALLWRYDDALGWGLAVLSLIPLVMVAFSLGRPATVMAAVRRAARRREAIPPGRSALARRYLVTLACLSCLLAPMISAISASAAPAKLAPVYVKGEPNWHPSFAEIKNGWVPQLNNADKLSRQHWFVLDNTSGGPLKLPQEFVSAYIAIYRGYRLDDHLTQDIDSLYHTDQWQLDEPFTLDGKVHSYSGLVLERKDSGRKVYVAMGFYIAGHWSPSADRAELNRIFSLVTGRPEMALIAVSVDCDGCTDWKAKLRAAADSISQRATAELDGDSSAD